MIAASDVNTGKVQGRDDWANAAARGIRDFFGNLLTSAAPTNDWGIVCRQSQYPLSEIVGAASSLMRAQNAGWESRQVGVLAARKTRTPSWRPHARSLSFHAKACFWLNQIEILFSILGANCSPAQL